MEETTSINSDFALGGQAKEPTVIRAVPGEPWPDPPAGGRWSRDAVTGDLTLIDQTEPAAEGKRRPDPTGALKEE